MNTGKSGIKVYIPIIIGVSISAGILIGMRYSEWNNSNTSSFQIYPRADKLSSMMNYIEQEYVDSISRDTLEEIAIPKILEQLDPHSIYIPASELQEANEPLEGNFSGIGVQFNMQEDTVIVISTITNGPSERVGILSGDRIVKINGEIVAGIKMPSDSVVKRLRGPKGTLVNVSVYRREKKDTLDFEITRDNIPLFSVDVSYMIKDDIGYIKISKFARTTFKEFVEGIAKLNEKGMKRLILDLRGNSGGYLDAATNIADQFLNNNELLVYTEGRARQRTNIYAQREGICPNTELIILIDEWSASASEILAGAIQDNDRGTIIGRRSFGKGLVQEQTKFQDGSALRLTIARYYTPTGRCIQKPYTNGEDDDYYSDLANRYIHGEFENADSIKLNDSLKYITPKGKVVYGGGGIMPDVFVPLDTIGVTPYYDAIMRKGLIYRFAFDYADKHRNVLGKLTTWQQIQGYLDSQTGLMKQFVAYASKNKVDENPSEYKISEFLIKTQLEAYIARNIIDNDGFYPILMEIDKTLLRAVEEFSK